MPRRLPFASNRIEATRGEGREREGMERIKERGYARAQPTRLVENKRASKIVAYGLCTCCHDNGRDVAGYRVQRGYRLLGTEFRSSPQWPRSSSLSCVNFANGERGEGAGFFLEIERDVWTLGRWNVGTRSRDCGNFDRVRL